MNAIKAKLQNCTPGDYRLHWNATRTQPIRYKIITSKQTAEKLNIIWSKELAKATGCKYVIGPQYIRINADYLEDTVTFSIFPNGTIMIQGKNSYIWLDENMEKICKKVQSEIEDSKSTLNESNDLDESSDSSIFENSISIKGICIVCNQEDDDEMFHCNIKTCNAWVHYKCDGLDENEASDMPIYYCKFCRNTYNLKIPRRQLNVTENSVSSKILTSVGLPSLSPDDSLNEIESSIHSDPELLYLKAVHTSLMNVNEDDDDEANEPKEILELKHLAKEMSEVYQREIVEKENNIKNLAKENTTVASSENIPENQEEPRQPQENAPSPSTKGKKDQKSQTYLKTDKEKLINSEETIKELNATIEKLNEKLAESELENQKMKNLEEKITELKETIKIAKNDQEKSEKKAQSLTVSLTAAENLCKKNLDKIKEQREKIISLEVEKKDLMEKNKKIVEMNELTNATDYEHVKIMLEETQTKLIKSNSTNEMLNTNLKALSKEKESLQEKYNKLRTENMPDCRNGLHEVEGYCEFRYDMKITQLQLELQEKNLKNDTLERQIEYDKIVILNQNKLLESAGTNLRMLSREEAKLAERNRNLINQIDILSGQTETPHANAPKTDDEWSTMNESRSSSISYSDVTKSTPKKGLEYRRINGAGILAPLNTLITKSFINEEAKEEQSNRKPQSTLNERFSTPNRHDKDQRHITNKENSSHSNKTEDCQQTSITNRRDSRNEPNDTVPYSFFDPKNKRARPICKFFTLSKCNSVRCIYYHPPDGKKNQIKQTTKVCKFFLENRCIFGDDCINEHPDITEY